MTGRRNLLLLGLAAAVVAGGVIALSPPEIAAPPSEAGSLAFPGLAPKLAGVVRIELSRGEEFLALERQGDRFVLPVRSFYPARPERVREALVGLTELRLVEPRTADPTQHERLGVDDPSRAGTNAVRVKLLELNGTVVADAVVGRRRVRTQGGLPESVYIRRPDEAQTWLAEGRLVVDVDPNLWIDRDIANLPLSRLVRATSHRTGAMEVVVAADAERGLRLVAPTNTPPIDESKVEEIGRAFEFLTLQEVVPESQVPGEALGEARFEFADGLTVTAWPSRAGPALWLRLRAEGASAEAERLDARWRGWAFQVGAWKERALLPRMEELVAAAPEPPERPPQR